MKVSGFTIVRNALIYDYPIVESIKSILPCVDEMVVAVGKSEDDTLGLIQSIGSPKIRIVETVWDDRLREGGRVLAVETDKAKQAIDPASDWCFYIQGDEVLHEKFVPEVLSALERFKNQPEIEGLLFRYLHFYGAYHYQGNSRKWYRKEVRIVRNDPEIHAYRDAQGFRKGLRKLQVAEIDAAIFHYGWVKNPKFQQAKQKNFHKFWHKDEELKKYVSQADAYDYQQIDSLENFNGSHPEVMKNRIALMDWDFQFDPNKRKMRLKDKLLIWFEKWTGYRLFEYKNYQKIK